MSARRRQSRAPTPLTLKDLPFKRLVQEDPDLASIRQEYKDKPARKRFMAAQWEYESSTATELFNQGITLAQGTTALTFATGPGPCPGAVLALAIDPTYAPALLTVGSAEYQLGRIDEAMELFLGDIKAVTLPTDKIRCSAFGLPNEPQKSGASAGVDGKLATAGQEQTEPADPVLAELSKLNLETVLVSARNRAAIINGQVLHCGETVNEFKIVEIEAGRVSMERGGKRYALQLK